MILLAFGVWMLDVADARRSVQYFLVFGANPLFAYVLAGLLTKTMIRIEWMEERRKDDCLQMDLSPRFSADRRRCVRFAAVCPLFSDGMLVGLSGVVPEEDFCKNLKGIHVGRPRENLV